MIHWHEMPVILKINSAILIIICEFLNRFTIIFTLPINLTKESISTSSWKRICCALSERCPCHQKNCAQKNLLRRSMLLLFKNLSETKISQPSSRALRRPSSSLNQIVEKSQSDVLKDSSFDVD